ncbi:hypothetical protein P3S67_027619 [Capsicum chacoense]
MEAIKSIVNPLSSFFVICILLLFANAASAETHYHDFVIQATTVKRLCKTLKIITVNGQFPRPTLEVNNGMGLGKSEHDGQMDQDLSLSAQLDQERVTLTDLQFKDRKGPFGGTPTARGLGLLFMEL